MLPAAGILLTERLYIGIKINSITDEPYSEYADQYTGSCNIDILDGRNEGFVVDCNGVRYTSSNGLGINMTGFNGGTDTDRHGGADIIGYDYPLDLYDRSTLVKNSVVVHIGYNGSGSWISYNGTNYSNGSFHFLNHH